MKHVAGVALALVIASAPSVVQAQEPWPSRSITFLVPYGAGGYTDLVGPGATLFRSRPGGALPGACIGATARSYQF